MNILLTGATGFIGQYLVPHLQQQGHEPILWVRSVKKAHQLYHNKVRCINELSTITQTDTIDGVINLAGEPIVDRRWSEQRKQQLIDSRVGITNTLVDWIAQRNTKPEVLVSGSAVGYYGDQQDSKLDEHSQPVDGFAHQLCAAWEAAAQRAADSGVRVCFIRTGLVLGRGGGILQKMRLPFSLGLGGIIGSGEQWMSWIHIDDEVAAITKLLTDTACVGGYNLTAPQAVTNEQFTRTLAQVLHRPAFFRTPACLLQFILGERAELLLQGQRVYPQRLLDAGFSFTFTDLAAALRQLL